MKLIKLAKDGSSGQGNCPTVYLADSGEMIVQGQLVDTDTFGELENPLPGETAVRIGADVVTAAVSAYLGQQSGSGMS